MLATPLSSSSLSPGSVVQDHETSGSCRLPKQEPPSPSFLDHDNPETNQSCQTQWTLPPPPPPENDKAAVAAVHPAIQEEWQQCWYHRAARNQQEQEEREQEETGDDHSHHSYLFLPTACMGLPEARYLLHSLHNNHHNHQDSGTTTAMGKRRRRRPLYRVELDSLQGPGTTLNDDDNDDDHHCTLLWYTLLVQFLRDSHTVGLACDPPGGLMDTNVSWPWIRALSSTSSIRQWELGLDLRYPCTVVSTLLQQQQQPPPQQQQHSTVSATSPRTSHPTGVSLCLLDRTPRRIQTDSSSSCCCSNLERLAQALEPVTNLEQVHLCYFQLNPTTPTRRTNDCVEEDPTSTPSSSCSMHWLNQALHGSRHSLRQLTLQEWPYRPECHWDWLVPITTEYPLLESLVVTVSPQAHVFAASRPEDNNNNNNNNNKRVQWDGPWESSPALCRALSSSSLHRLQHVSLPLLCESPTSIQTVVQPFLEAFVSSLSSSSSSMWQSLDLVPLVSVNRITSNTTNKNQDPPTSNDDSHDIRIALQEFTQPIGLQQTMKSLVQVLSSSTTTTTTATTKVALQVDYSSLPHMLPVQFWRQFIPTRTTTTTTDSATTTTNRSTATTMDDQVGNRKPTPTTITPLVSLTLQGGQGRGLSPLQVQALCHNLNTTCPHLTHLTLPLSNSSITNHNNSINNHVVMWCPPLALTEVTVQLPGSDDSCPWSLVTQLVREQSHLHTLRLYGVPPTFTVTPCHLFHETTRACSPLLILKGSKKQAQTQQRHQPYPQQEQEQHELIQTIVQHASLHTLVLQTKGQSPRVIHSAPPTVLLHEESHDFLASDGEEKKLPDPHDKDPSNPQATAKRDSSSLFLDQLCHSLATPSTGPSCPVRDLDDHHHNNHE